MAPGDTACPPDAIWSLIEGVESTQTKGPDTPQTGPTWGNTKALGDCERHVQIFGLQTVKLWVCVIGGDIAMQVAP